MRVSFTFYFIAPALTCYSAELEQRDWLVKSKVFLKVLNLQEVRLVVHHMAPNPCTSATMLLATLLRVSVNILFLPRNSYWFCYQPHSHQYPLHFPVDSIDTPHLFYTLDFESHHLPPPERSFGFNVLFALPIQPKSMLSMQLARFVLHVSADIWSIAEGLKLWDLTFRVDHNHVFGTLQFETRDRHLKIQMEGNFFTNSLIAIDPDTNNAIFYRELTGISIPDRAVSTYMRQINKSIRYVPLSILHAFFLTLKQRVDQKWGYIWLAESACHTVNTYQLLRKCNSTISILTQTCRGEARRGLYILPRPRARI